MDNRGMMDQPLMRFRKAEQRLRYNRPIAAVIFEGIDAVAALGMIGPENDQLLVEIHRQEEWTAAFEQTDKMTAVLRAVDGMAVGGRSRIALADEYIDPVIGRIDADIVQMTGVPLVQ